MLVPLCSRELGTRLRALLEEQIRGVLLARTVQTGILRPWRPVGSASSGGTLGRHSFFRWRVDLVANLVTTSKAPVTTSVALVSTSFLLLLVRHLLLEAMHLFLGESTLQSQLCG